jgi:hypothetical protein
MLDIADNDRPIDARAASAYLTARGVPIAEATLAKARSVGGGPVFLRFGRRIRYRPSALADWLACRTRELRNTSEAA